MPPEAAHGASAGDEAVKFPHFQTLSLQRFGGEFKRAAKGSVAQQSGRLQDELDWLLGATQPKPESEVGEGYRALRRAIHELPFEHTHRENTDYQRLAALLDLSQLFVTFNLPFDHAGRDAAENKPIRGKKPKKSPELDAHILS